MDKPKKFDHVDKNFDSLKKIKDKLSVSPEALEDILAAASRFAQKKENEERLARTPRMYMKALWKDITHDFVEDEKLAAKWSKKRAAYDANNKDALAWPDDKEDILFLCFCILKWQLKHHSAEAKKRKGNGEADSEAEGSTPAKKKKKATETPAKSGANVEDSIEIDEESPDEADGGEDKNPGRSKGKAKATKKTKAKGTDNGTDEHKILETKAAEAKEKKTQAKGASAKKNAEDKEPKEVQDTMPAGKKKKQAAASAETEHEAAAVEKKTAGRKKGSGAAATSEPKKPTKKEKQTAEKVAQLKKAADEAAALANAAELELDDEDDDDLDMHSSDIEDSVMVEKDDVDEVSSAAQAVGSIEEHTGDDTKGKGPAGAVKDKDPAKMDVAAVDDKDKDKPKEPITPTGQDINMVDVSSLPRTPTPGPRRQAPHGELTPAHTPKSLDVAPLKFDKPPIFINFEIKVRGAEHGPPVSLKLKSTETWVDFFEKVKHNSSGAQKEGIHASVATEVNIPGGCYVVLIHADGPVAVQRKWKGLMDIAEVTVGKDRLFDGEKLRLVFK